MSCVEPALKRKKEDTMDHEEAPTTASSQSSQFSAETGDINTSPDIFKDCTPIESVNLCAEGYTSDEDGNSVVVEINQHAEGTQQRSPSPTLGPSVKAGPSQGTVLPPLTWKGTSVKELKKGPNGYGYPQICPIKPSNTHAVLFQMVGGKPEVAKSMPDAWDSDHVRMPFSPKSQYPVGDILRPRWEMVESALQRPITNSRELEEAIMSYNYKYSNRWDFTGLHQFFNEVIERPETRCFFTVLLPQMVHLALQLPQLVTQPIPLLRQHRNQSVSLSQLQVACLLANAFFCTFPRRNTARQASEYASFPDINFNRLFQMQKRKKSMQRTFEKLKCLFHYFRRVCHEAPKGSITFSRRYIPSASLPVWERSSHYFRKLYISSAGNIEDDGKGMLQVDFANKMVGGGVLGWGCVQEEIRFVICPELIISRLFTECLDSNEALIIAGCEQFSKYQGYADDFTWDGDYQDETPHDSSGRMLCTVVAIDALALRFPSQQFNVANLTRELNKAYVGFSSPDVAPEHLGAVATGNWGCGVYRGNAHLKALLQMLAASQAGRPIAYFTFGNAQLQDDVAQMHKFLVENHVTVGTVWRHLTQYHDQCYRNGCFTMDLYDFLYQSMDSSYIPKMNPKQGRNKAPSPHVKLGQSPVRADKKAASSSPSTSPKKSVTFAAGPLTTRLSDQTAQPPKVVRPGQSSVKPLWGRGTSGCKQADSKDSERKKPLDSTTKPHWNDDTRLQKAQASSTQKRIYDYFYELNIPK